MDHFHNWLATLLRSAGHRVTALDLAASGINNQKQVNDLQSFSNYIEPLMEFFMDYGSSLPNTIRRGAIDDEQQLAEENKGSKGDIIYAYDEGPDNPPTTFIFGPNYMASHMYQLCPPEELSLATLLVRPIRIYSKEEMPKAIVMSREKYGSVRIVYVISGQDKEISEEMQRSIIQNDPTIIEVKEITGSDHMVMLSKPQELSACLQEIADS